LDFSEPARAADPIVGPVEGYRPTGDYTAAGDGPQLSDLLRGPGAELGRGATIPAEGWSSDALRGPTGLSS
jgi:hypothetical protein